MDTYNSHINNGSLHRRGPARCCSLSSSESMNSDRSIGLPCNFNGEVPHPDDSCHESMESDFSMDIPTNFKEGGPLLGDSDSSCLLTAADHVRCVVCPSILRQPAVSIPCSYCKRCVDTRWSRPGPAGDYVCPWCDEVLNWRLQAGCCYRVGPACDVCSSETRPAIKTCVTCDASYCENHIRHHYTVPALQRHTLAPVKYDTLTPVNYDTLAPVNYDTLTPVNYDTLTLVS